MKQLKTTYRELREGIYQLMAMNLKGEYANINVKTGKIIYCKKVTKSIPSQSQEITVTEFEKGIINNSMKWLSKNYAEWRNKYPEVYNNMINKINNLEII